MEKGSRNRRKAESKNISLYATLQEPEFRCFTLNSISFHCLRSSFFFIFLHSARGRLVFAHCCCRGSSSRGADKFVRTLLASKQVCLMDVPHQSKIALDWMTMQEDTVQ
jgi:hypothetical protein